MGQFSWITQDTGEAIRECYGCDDQELTTAYMWDNKGNVWKETKYEGYGKFGGKDFYELLAEMNGLKASKEEIVACKYGDTDEEKYTEVMRSKGIDLFFDKDRTFPIIGPNLTRKPNWKWKIGHIPEDDPNQGWGIDEYYDEYDDEWDD